MILKMPKLRSLPFETAIIERYRRRESSVEEALVETFNSSYRDECLNVHWFETLEEAKAISEAWRRDYNETRPHMALKDVLPEEYAVKS